MVDDLRGRDHVQPAVAVQLGERAERLHHGLVIGLRVVGALQHHVAIGQHGLDVAAGVGGGAHQVARIVAAQVAQHMPVVFGVHQHEVVLSGAEIQDGLQHVVLHLDARKGSLRRLLVLGRHDGHHIAHEAHVTVDDQAIVGAGFGVGLPGVGETLVGHILPGVHVNHAGNLLGLRRVDGLHHGVGVGAS